MILVKVGRNAAGSICRFQVSGHANTAPYGQDIVCAAVSAVTQTAVLGVERQLGRRFQLEIKSGKLSFTLEGEPDDLTDAVLETMVCGLSEIEKINPQSVLIKERRR